MKKVVTPQPTFNCTERDPTNKPRSVLGKGEEETDYEVDVDTSNEVHGDDKKLLSFVNILEEEHDEDKRPNHIFSTFTQILLIMVILLIIVALAVLGWRRKAKQDARPEFQMEITRQGSISRSDTWSVIRNPSLSV